MTAVVFLDDGGVLSDNERRGAQWREHLGRFLSRELGGTSAAWAAANVAAFERVWARWLAAMRAGVAIAAAQRDYELVWMRDMAERVGVPLAGDDDEVVALARRVARYVTERVRAFHPEVLTTVRELKRRGHSLHTASGGTSDVLEAYLRAEGVRELFGTPYGVDIVDTWKGSASYYTAVFRHAGVTAADAVVVDDLADAVGWARESGATAYLMDRAGTSGDPSALRSLDQLLARL